MKELIEQLAKEIRIYEDLIHEDSSEINTLVQELKGHEVSQKFQEAFKTISKIYQRGRSRDINVTKKKERETWKTKIEDQTKD